MKRSEFAQLAFKQRYKIIQQWARISDLPDYSWGKELIDEALYRGFVPKRGYVSTPTLSDWCQNNTAPLWACKSALMLCLRAGWKPKNSEDWAIFSYLYVRIFFDKPLLVMISQLPEQIPRHIAAGWLHTAIDDGGQSKSKQSQAAAYALEQ